jgi:hypothetical protein
VVFTTELALDTIAVQRVADGNGVPSVRYM